MASLVNKAQCVTQLHIVAESPDCYSLKDRKHCGQCSINVLTSVLNYSVRVKTAE